MSEITEASPLNARVTEDRLLERADFFDRQSEEYISSVSKDLRNAAAEVRQVRRLRAENAELKESIKRRNHCIECKKLNPVDNVCEDCYRELDL